MEDLDSLDRLHRIVASDKELSDERLVEHVVEADVAQVRILDLRDTSPHDAVQGDAPFDDLLRNGDDTRVDRVDDLVDDIFWAADVATKRNLVVVFLRSALALSFAARSGRVVAVLVVADGVPVVADGVPVVADGVPVVADGVPVVADTAVVADVVPVVADGVSVVARSFKLLACSLSIPFLYVLGMGRGANFLGLRNASCCC